MRGVGGNSWGEMRGPSDRKSGHSSTDQPPGRALVGLGPSAWRHKRMRNYCLHTPIRNFMLLVSHLSNDNQSDGIKVKQQSAILNLKAYMYI